LAGDCFEPGKSARLSQRHQRHAFARSAFYDAAIPQIWREIAASLERAPSSRKDTRDMSLRLLRAREERQALLRNSLRFLRKEGRLGAVELLAKTSGSCLCEERFLRRNNPQKVGCVLNAPLRRINKNGASPTHPTGLCPSVDSQFFVPLW
jgi:hypothetical protein